MKKVILAVAFAFATVALVGCGGGSSTTKKETKPETPKEKTNAVTPPKTEPPKTEPPKTEPPKTETKGEKKDDKKNGK